MWLSRFRIRSFSSFNDSGWIELDPRFNLFIGQNNSGKSALLRAIPHPLPDNSHKSASAFRGNDLQPSKVEFDVKIGLEELFSRFSMLGGTPTFPAGRGSRDDQQRLETYLNTPEQILTLELYRAPGHDAAPRGGASLADFRNPGQQSVLTPSRSDGKVSFESGAPRPDNLASVFQNAASGAVFHFDAQRLNVARSAWNSPDRLESNASNLAAVLARLQGVRRPVFDTIERHVLEILGGIERITVAPRENGQHEILVWPEREAVFEELSFSLNDSGTGVGQLLAILTAVVTSEQSIILVDEINSFLHPAAVKRLLALLRSEYPHHQYIISTHSADAIASCNAERLYIVERYGFDSTVREVKLEDAAHAREVAGALGFSMMDVFGYDRMVWVEGPTEEICFPFLVRKFGIEMQVGLGFASVSSPSAITGANARDRAIVDIYERAGKQLSPLLKGMAFALDRERLSDEEVAKQERSKRKLRLLPRRCLECFLLQPEAIAEAVGALDGRALDRAAVETMLGVGAEQKFGASKHWTGDLGDRQWLKHVDGAKLLNEVFTGLTDSRVEYRKTRDAITLLRWIAENEPADLADLVEFLKRVVDTAHRDTAP